MTWAKFSDTFFEEMDDADISIEAALLHAATTCYCMRVLNDGRFPKRKARNMYSAINDPEATVQELLDAGFWVEVGTEYEIVNFLRDQRPAETIRRERGLKNERQKRYMEKVRADRASRNDASYDASTDANPAQPSPALKEDGMGGAATASASAGASASPPRPEVKTNHKPPEPINLRFGVNGVQCRLQTFPLNDGVNGPLTDDDPHTCVEFGVVDERVDSGEDHPVGRQIAALHQAVYEKAQELARERNYAQPGAGSKANFYGVEIEVPDDQVTQWVEIVRAAATSAEVEALVGPLLEMAAES
jgi:hypothetical protein